MKSAQTQAWADHLRSTTKMQGHGYLALKHWDTIRYCCMGFGCTLIPSLKMVTSEGGEIFSFDGHSKYPPKAFLRWLGFTTVPAHDFDTVSHTLRVDWPWSEFPNGQGTVGGGEYMYPLASFNFDYLNDTDKFTFAQIGDMIAYFGIVGGWEE